MVFRRLQRGEEMDELEPGPLTLSVAPMNLSDDAPGKSQGTGEVSWAVEARSQVS